MTYSKVEVFGGCHINYLHVKNKVDTMTEVENEVKAEIYKPTWETNTSMLATFQNKSLAATPLTFLNDEKLVGYKVQRYDIEKDIMENISTVSNSSIYDYTAKGNKKYQYYIFPIIEIDGKRTIDSPMISNEFTPKWEMSTICGLKKTDKRNEYVVDTENIWRFYLNTEQGQYELNLDKEYNDGFDRFAKRSQGTKKYVTTNVDSIIGMPCCETDSVDIKACDIEKWEDFCYSSNLKLYNDGYGRIIPCDIQSASTGYFVKNFDSPVTVSFSIIQLADINDISVYGLVGDE